MRILVVDTTKQNSHIVLFGEDFFANKVLDVVTKVSESLLPSIESLLLENKISLSDIDAFGVVTGPGSFTGVRVGVATIKAFAQALHKNIVAINSFDVLDSVIDNGLLYLKCTNTSSYCARYLDGKVTDMCVVNNTDAVLDNVGQLENEVVFDNVGSIITNYPQILANAFLEKYKAREFVEYNKLEPMYLQLSQAEIALIEKEKKNA